MCSFHCAHTPGAAGLFRLRSIRPATRLFRLRSIRRFLCGTGYVLVSLRAYAWCG